MEVSQSGVNGMSAQQHVMRVWWRENEYATTLNLKDKMQKIADI